MRVDQDEHGAVAVHRHLLHLPAERRKPPNAAPTPVPVPVPVPLVPVPVPVPGRVGTLGPGDEFPRAPLPPGCHLRVYGDAVPSGEKREERGCPGRVSVTDGDEGDCVVRLGIRAAESASNRLVDGEGLRQLFGVREETKAEEFRGAPEPEHLVDVSRVRGSLVGEDVSGPLGVARAVSLEPSRLAIGALGRPVESRRGEALARHREHALASARADVREVCGGEGAAEHLADDAAEGLEGNRGVVRGEVRVGVAILGVERVQRGDADEVLSGREDQTHALDPRLEVARQAPALLARGGEGGRRCRRRGGGGRGATAAADGDARAAPERHRLAGLVHLPLRRQRHDRHHGRGRRLLHPRNPSPRA